MVPIREEVGSVSLLLLVAFARTPTTLSRDSEVEEQMAVISVPSEQAGAKINKYQVGLQTLKDAAGGAAAEFTKSVLSSATISAATWPAMILVLPGCNGSWLQSRRSSVG